MIDIRYSYNKMNKRIIFSILNSNPASGCGVSMSEHGSGTEIGKHGGVVSGRTSDSQSRGSGFDTHWRHCVVCLSKTH